MTRILHIVGGMNRGGVETWLMHVLRHIDRSRYQMDFLVETTDECAYDAEIRSLGSQIIPCLNPSSRPLSYARHLRAILETGRYDVVHSHVHHYSGWTLRTAAQAGVPVRIAHSHTDTSAQQARASLLRRAYLGLMKYWIHQYATHKLSVSGLAANALFGPGWEADPRHRLLYYGIDLAPFAAEVDGGALRSSLGIPSEAFVIGHVGRFVEAKNHRFLIEIAAEVIRRQPDARFLLVGDGPLRPVIEQQVGQAGLSEQVVFAGLRDDVPALMLGVMNGFIFPSLYEGLPVTLLEVQAAGLPAVISDMIAKETDLVRPLLYRMSLDQAAKTWAERSLAFQDGCSVISQLESLKLLQDSSFSIEQSIRSLSVVYDG